MGVNKEGLSLILLVLTGSIILLLAGIKSHLPILVLLAIIGFVKAGFFCYFFRDPDRTPDGNYKEDKMLLSPADGKILEIVNEPDGNTKTIRIFLSVFNVHIQRSPCAGKISRILFQKGEYLPAMKENAHSQNTQNIITLTSNSGEEITVRQIVGILARRLVLWKKEGDTVAAAERIGMIKFGSQVDITFPISYKPVVSPGETVSGGQTIIAEK